MKTFAALMFACAATAFGGVATASPDASPEPRILPVVVNVNAQGQVTGTMPAANLRPAYRDLLAKQLGIWITKPAVVNGHPAPSRFLLEVAVHVAQRDDKSFALSYSYVKALPIPFTGPVHWQPTDGGRNVTLVANSESVFQQHWRQLKETAPQVTTLTRPRASPQRPWH